MGTSLQDGTVLVVGGLGEGGIPLVTAERFKLFGNGTLCNQAADCQSGFCVDGVCCDTACDGGPCDVCAIRLDITLIPTGAQTPGVCEPVDGVKCDDGDACTHAGLSTSTESVSAGPAVSASASDASKTPPLVSSAELLPAGSPSTSASPPATTSAALENSVLG